MKTSDEFLTELIDSWEALAERANTPYAGVDLEVQRKILVAKADAARALQHVVTALRAVTELADGWEQRGAHLKEFSETVPDELRTALHDSGTEMVNRAYVLRHTLTQSLKPDTKE